MLSVKLLVMHAEITLFYQIDFNLSVNQKPSMTSHNISSKTFLLKISTIICSNKYYISTASNYSSKYKIHEKNCLPQNSFL